MAVFNNILAGAAGQTGGAAAGYEIERSLRFNSADSAYLNKNFSSAGNRKTYTISFWAKCSNHDDGATQGFGGGQIFTAGTTGAGARASIGFPGPSGGSNQDKFVVAHNATGSTWATLSSNAVFRDFSAWQHFVVAVDCSQGTASNRVKVYVNGSQITMSGTYPSDENQAINNNVGHAIGRYNPEGKDYFNGYLADVHFIDGQALAPTDFGEYDDNNVWQPKAYSGTYGTNGFKLDFSDNTSTTTIAEDSSGNNNDFTANNISVASGAGNDSLFDAPTNGSQSDTGAGGEVSGNYCTMNPLALSDSSSNASVSLANGNLEVRNARTNYWGTALSTIPVTSGKWYFEGTCVGGISWEIGIYGVDPIDSRFYTDDEAIGYSSTGYGYKHNGDKVNNLTSSSYGATYGANDVIGVALDLDGGTLTFYKNGTSQGTAFSSLSGKFALAVSCSGNNSGWNLNFGQRAFTYQNAGTDRPADTFKALCTTNLTDPTIADGSTAFEAKLYSNAPSSVSGLSFSPDFVWLKRRSAAADHGLYDIVRGANKLLYSNATNSEETAAGVSAFNSDGFDLGTNALFKGSGNTFVAWCWDGGTSTATNTDGSITSSVRANPSAGFSIVNTPSIDSTSTIRTAGHGLNATPYFIISKNRDFADNWFVYHKDIQTDNKQRLNLNTTGTVSSAAATLWAHTSSVIGFNGAQYVASGNTDDLIFYCWAPVAGYSSMGSYIGNGSSDGTFVYTGHRSRFLLIKALIDGEDWVVIDTEREPYNTIDSVLFANDTTAEITNSAYNTDILSNGFKLRGNNPRFNTNGETYVFASFAEHPFKTARAR